MRKNSQQLSWPWQINKSLPWRLEERGLSGTENNMDIDELLGRLRKENWRCFIKGGKEHHLEKSLGLESCPHLSNVLGILHVPTPPPTTTSESFLMLLCSALYLKYELSRKYQMSFAFLLCLANGKLARRQEESEPMFFDLHPSLLKLEE